MNARIEFGTWLSAALIGIPLSAAAQTTAPSGSPISTEQQEADYRVIAARCGTPGFEKAFYKQSKAAVAAGLISKNRDAAEVEKKITALRRNPFVLVAAPTDCPAQLAMLTEVQKTRSAAVHSARGRKAPPK
ncbi:MAG: hypothetical protein EOP82_01625 [Variovorax sp.]|nr:MAG: hypothetical protein EOP82_01625 [Variovorax sp.]